MSENVGRSRTDNEPERLCLQAATLIIERERAGLEIPRKLGRKQRMTDSKTESAKKLRANGIPPEM
ncbi:MAG: hypothetical protein P4L69_11020 [Desulfosporosinus sp.]|nr:hypothetical protein [Desulfosporosinus sp.]